MCLFFLIIILRIFFADDFTFVYNHISPYFPKPFLFTVQTKKILSGAHAPRSCLLTFRQSRAVLHRMVKLLTKHPRLCEPPSTNTNSSKPSYFYPGSANIYSRKIDSTTFHPRRNICTTTAPAQKKTLTRCIRHLTWPRLTTAQREGLAKQVMVAESLPAQQSSSCGSMMLTVLRWRPFRVKHLYLAENRR